MIFSKKIQACVLIALFISHVALFFIDNDSYIKGGYFSSGVIITGRGDVLESTQRQYYNENSVYSYEMFDGNNYYTIMRRRLSFLGYVYYVVIDNNNIEPFVPGDFWGRDIYFNRFYSSRVGSLLTMNVIDFPESKNWKCFYIDELFEVKCYGLIKY